MTKKLIYLSLLSIFLPTLVLAEIKVTEIAWMGTNNSQFSEWIEFYNDESTTVDLNGWKLYEAGGSVLVFTFTKSISGNGYLLLERTTSSAPDAVPGVDDESGSFGGSGLANTGENLVLKNSSDTVIESLDYTDGWPAGDASTKETMQLFGSSWVTAVPTPKDATIGNEEEEEEEPALEKDPDPIPIISPNKPQVEFIIPQVIFPGVIYQFEANPVLEYNYRINHGKFYWNMGDGTVFRQDFLAPISHSYQYKGEYIISFLYTDPTNYQPQLKGSKKIKVTQPALELSIVENRGLEIKNNSSIDTDISAWHVLTSKKEIIIPDMTVIAAKATAVIPFSILSLENSNSTISILDPSGRIVSTTKISKNTEEPRTKITQIVEQISDSSEPEVALASTENIFEEDKTEKRNRTKNYIFGAVALFVIGLSILLERFMARQEY